MQSVSMIAVYFMYVITFIFGVFLVIRGGYRFRELRDLEKNTWIKSDTFWWFLSLAVGAIATFVCFGGMITYEVAWADEVFPNTITPSRPLPSGKASSHISAGSLYHKISSSFSLG